MSPAGAAVSVLGSGISVGVISDGIDGASRLHDEGALPDVTVPPLPGCRSGAGDRGTAMLAVVHETAPGARLLFAAGARSVRDFIAAVECLRDAGAQVIVDDVVQLADPVFQDGPTAGAVADAVQAGISYHVAAGDLALTHLRQDFFSKSDDDFQTFAVAMNDETGTDSVEYVHVTVRAAGYVVCVLEWNEPLRRAKSDYDLTFRLSAQDDELIDSSATQKGRQDPRETVAHANRAKTDSDVLYDIEKFRGEPHLLDVRCAGDIVEQHIATSDGDVPFSTPEGSVFGHAAVSSAVTVGATDDEGHVLPSSGRGPVKIFFPTVEVRAKPDLVASGARPAAIEDTIAMSATAAAAARSAGTAAILRGRNPALTPAAVRDVLTGTAVPLADPGAGAGRLETAAAVNAVAATALPCDPDDPPSIDGDDPCQETRCDLVSGRTPRPRRGFDAIPCALSGVERLPDCASARDAIQRATARVSDQVDRVIVQSRSGRVRAARRSLARIRATVRSLARSVGHVLPIGGRCATAFRDAAHDVSQRARVLQRELGRAP